MPNRVVSGSSIIRRQQFISNRSPKIPSQPIEQQHGANAMALSYGEDEPLLLVDADVDEETGITPSTTQSLPNEDEAGEGNMNHGRNVGAVYALTPHHLNRRRDLCGEDLSNGVLWRGNFLKICKW